MNKEREKIITWLKDKIDRNIIFDCVPENDIGWHEIKRESVIAILDGLIPMLKTEGKKLNMPGVSGRSEQLKALNDLKDWCYENVSLHTEDALNEILERL